MKDSKVKRVLVQLYEVLYEQRRRILLRTKYRMHIMTGEQTVKYIERTHCSIARFGDGEFDILLKKRGAGFQNLNDNLSLKLRKILDGKDANCLICIPGTFNGMGGYKAFVKKFWVEWAKEDNRQMVISKLLLEHTGKGYVFGDTQITRPYMDLERSDYAERMFPMLKELWKDRSILIVEGTLTRLGVGNDLFADAHSVKRILCPAKNAFDSYEDILKEVLSKWDNELVLIALGMTATVLAADLSLAGIQALDVGHIDIEYEWYTKGCSDKIPIRYKYVNELKEAGTNVEECLDPDYLGQIIAQIQ